MLLLLLSALLVLSQGQDTWVIQNIYRKVAGCLPEDLISINSWRAGVCAPLNTTHYSLRVCTNTKVTSTVHTDAACTSASTKTTEFPANQCGSTATSQGVFFACEALTGPPTLPNQNNDVYNDLVYLNSASDRCGASQIYQSLSYIGNNVCVLGEARACVCSGSSCTGYTLTTPCGGTTGPVTPLGGCADTDVSGVTYQASTACLAAVAPTPAPTDPENPPGTNSSTLSACSDATTFDQCVNGVFVPPQNFPTLPVTGLIRKCCVWCAGPSGSTCKEPGFSGSTCSCPPNTTSVSDLKNIYQCPNGQDTNLACSCTGRPFGAASCTSFSGGIDNAAEFLRVPLALLIVSAVLCIVL